METYEYEPKKQLLVAAEVWEWTSPEDEEERAWAVVACVRCPTGVYRVFTGGDWERSSKTGKVPASAKPLATDRFLSALDALENPKRRQIGLPQGELDGFLTGVVGLSPSSTEFAIERAACKYVRRLLSLQTRAAKTEIGWEPKPGWKRMYDGRLTVQKWDLNARENKRLRKLAELKNKQAKELEELQEAIEKDDNQKVARFEDSDGDFAARRRRKMDLIQKKKELESVQGGTK